MYARHDVVTNLQRVALLTAALASRRGDLIAEAMGDRLHQPYRAEVCPILDKLLPLAGHHGIAGVALSGAGPAVLLLITSEMAAAGLVGTIREATEGAGQVEILMCGLETKPAQVSNAESPR
jgi:homoserine kinase